jgi:hypothetical protein
MWAGPPDLLSNWTHKCLELALTLIITILGYAAVQLGAQLLCFRGTSLGKKAAETYQTAWCQNSEDGDNATFTHQRTL